MNYSIHQPIQFLRYLRGHFYTFLRKGPNVASEMLFLTLTSCILSAQWFLDSRRRRSIGLTTFGLDDGLEGEVIWALWIRDEKVEGISRKQKKDKYKSQRAGVTALHRNLSCRLRLKDIRSGPLRVSQWHPRTIGNPFHLLVCLVYCILLFHLLHVVTLLGGKTWSTTAGIHGIYKGELSNEVQWNLSLVFLEPSLVTYANS